MFGIIWYNVCMGKKEDKQQNSGKIIIPANHPNPPEPHEVDTAMILARHFQCVVEFIIPIDDYKRKSADILMQGIEWEIKSPYGASKSTIGNQFQFATKQSKNIILDTRRTKLDDENIRKKVLIEIKKRSSIKKVILVNKFENVVEIKI